MFTGIECLSRKRFRLLVIPVGLAKSDMLTGVLLIVLVIIFSSEM